MTHALRPIIAAAAVLAALLGVVGIAPAAACLTVAALAACAAAALPRPAASPADRTEPPVAPAAAPETPPPAPTSPALTDALALLRDGDLTRRVAGEGADQANAALAAAQSALDEAQALAELLASGDLSVRESDAHRGQYGALLKGIGHVAGGLRTMIAAIAEAAREVEGEAVALRGDADQLTDGMTAQSAALAQARAASDGLREALASVRGSADAGEAAAGRAAEAATRGQADAGQAESAIGAVVARSREIRKLLTATKTIAQQTKLLGVNAAVEAARAGEAGRGFAVVAAEIQALATRAGEASAEIESQLAQNDAAVQSCADVMTRGAEALARIGEEVRAVSAASADIRGACALQEEAVAQSLDGVAAAETAAAAAAAVARRNGGVVTSLNAAASRLHAQLDGILLSDDSMADAVTARAAEISRLFEDGVRTGRIGMAALFSDDYTLIEGSNPPQYMTPFVGFTDSVLPPVLESAFDLGDGVTFSAAVNRDGFLPTHNRKFSQPQGSDVAKNGALSRNRRFFDDRVGLGAGRSTRPHLIQAYRRDMGGGRFVTMKDISAPIMVQGRHWGGLRIGYTAASNRLGEAQAAPRAA